MRIFFSSILLIIVLIALAATAFYHYSTNANLEFETRLPNEPEKTTHVIDINQLPTGTTEQ
ncbi:MAG: hypothetical protein Q4C05_03740 [Akkermansia sp.]|nr:hypothetical protein [Akkermansia sp.]